jgi:hypothetical protein
MCSYGASLYAILSGGEKAFQASIGMRAPFWTAVDDQRRIPVIDDICMTDGVTNSARFAGAALG